MNVGLLADAAATAASPRGREWHREVGWGLLTAALAVATAAIPLVHTPSFYFTDDNQIYFLPGFLEIARLIKAGEWPFLTPRLFQGGAFLSEYQYALFNPVCVALYLLLDGFERLDRAAAFYALVHVGLLAGGVHALARTVGTSRPAAVLAGLTAATSGWIIYWGAITWTPALVSTAWLSWAAAALIRTYREPGFVPPAAITVALTIASGWPFSDAALVAGLGSGLGLAFCVGRDRRACLRTALAAVLGGLLATPSWLPLAAAIGSSSRQPESLFSDMLRTPPAVLLAMGVPVWPQAWLGFGGWATHAGPPAQYVSWWVPVALANASWTRLREPSGRAAAVLLAATGLLAMLAVAPGISQFRWPFRFLPYVQIGCAVVAAWFASRDRWTPLPTLALIAAGGALGLARDPALLSEQVALTGIILLAAVLGLRMQSGARLAAAAASHVVVFGLLTQFMSFNGQVGAWPAPVERSAYRAPLPGTGNASIVLHGNALFEAPMTPEVRAAAFTELPHGNTVLLTGAAALSGYSPMPARGFTAICMGRVGQSCPEAAERLARVDPVSGASTLDLARVVRVAAEKGAQAELFAAVAGPNWTRRAGTTADLFERSGTATALPGTLSAGPDGFRVATSTEGAEGGRYAVVSPAGGRVVWARAWYPGYAACWNGTPLTVEIVNGFLVSVLIPPGEGVLTLRYVPAGLLPGLAVAAAAALALAGLLLARRWIRARDAPLG